MPSEPKSTLSTRDKALMASWEACGKPCSMADWWLSFESWDVLPVEVSGEVVGAIFGKGPEVHIAVSPEHHRNWAKPSMWRWAFTDRIKKYGYVMTKGREDNQFILRAGFKPVQEISGITLFVRC